MSFGFLGEEYIVTYLKSWIICDYIELIFFCNPSFEGYLLHFVKNLILSDF